MNENTNQITEEQLEQVAQQIKPQNQESVEKNVPMVTNSKKSSGLLIIILLLVLVAGLVFFVYQMMLNTTNTTNMVEQPKQQVGTESMVKQKEPSKMTEDELYDDLEKDVDQSMSDLDKDIDSIETELNQLTNE